jgi:phenylacetate-CoA ligase
MSQQAIFTDAMRDREHGGPAPMSGTQYHIPDEETPGRPDLEQLQRRKLAAMYERISASNAFYRRKLAGIDFDPLVDPLERLPFTTRRELEQDQIDHPLYGSNLTEPIERYCRYHQTSGSMGRPMRWLDTAENWN